MLIFLELNTELLHEKLSLTPGTTFIDEFMKVMDLKANKHNYIMNDAFVPGDSSDVVNITQNKRVDLQDFLCKVLRKEKFYRVKTDHFAKGPCGTKIEDIFQADKEGGILINITINKVYVFNKSLREIEEFFKKLITTVESSPLILNLI